MQNRKVRIIKTLGIIVLLVLAGCQKVPTKSKNQTSKRVTQIGHPVDSVDPSPSETPTPSKLTTALQNYTEQTPEDASTRKPNGEVTYSQFYFRKGNWYWRLSSGPRKVIADGKVIALKAAADPRVKTLKMLSTSGKTYYLQVSDLDSSRTAYSVRTNYQNIKGLYICGDDLTTWKSGVPAVLAGTWRTDFYSAQQIDGSDSVDQLARTKFFIGSKTLTGVNSLYDQKHRLKASGANWGSNGAVHYKKLTTNNYLLKDQDPKTKQVMAVYRVSLQSDYLKVVGKPLMKRISSKVE